MKLHHFKLEHWAHVDSQWNKLFCVIYEESQLVNPRDLINQLLVILFKTQLEIAKDIPIGKEDLVRYILVLTKHQSPSRN